MLHSVRKPAMPPIAPNPIETPRLVVRLFAEADLPALMEVNGDDEVTRFVPCATWQSLDDARAWFKRMSDLQAAGKALQFVLITKATGKAIGTCLLFHFEETTASAELGYVLGQVHWGHGYMREALTALINRAFDHLSLRTLDATVDVRNVCSTRLLLGLGFVDAGLPHQHEITKGEPTETGIYRLHKQAWSSRAVVQNRGVILPRRERRERFKKRDSQARIATTSFSNG